MTNVKYCSRQVHRTFSLSHSHHLYLEWCTFLAAINSPSEIKIMWQFCTKTNFAQSREKMHKTYKTKFHCPKDIQQSDRLVGWSPDLLAVLALDRVTTPKVTVLSKQAWNSYKLSTLGNSVWYTELYGKLTRWNYYVFASFTSGTFRIQLSQCLGTVSSRFNTEIYWVHPDFKIKLREGNVFTRVCSQGEMIIMSCSCNGWWHDVCPCLVSCSF